MTTSAIGRLLDSYLTELEGEDGFEDVQIFVLSDDPTTECGSWRRSAS